MCLDEICSVPPPLHTLKIWGAGVYSPRSYGAEFVFLFLFVHHATMLGTESLNGVYTQLNLGGTGISPLDKSPPGQKTPRQAPPDKNPPGQKCPRAKDPRRKIPPGKRPPGQKHPRTKIPPAPDTQQAATYSVAAVASN